MESWNFHYEIVIFIKITNSNTSSNLRREVASSLKGIHVAIKLLFACCDLNLILILELKAKHSSFSS